MFVDTLTTSGDSNFCFQGGTGGSVSNKVIFLGIGGIRIPASTNSSPTVGDIWLDSTENEIKSLVSSGNTRYLTGNVRSTGNYSLTAATHNLNTGTSEIVKLDNTMGFDLDLTGIVAGVEGQVKFITNVSSSGNNVIIKHNNGSSSAANRFRCVGSNDIVLTLNKTVLSWYDSVIQAWRVS
jgi:hypothetical protein